MLALAALAPIPLRAQTMDDAIYTFVRLDEAELAPGAPGRPIRLDGEAWVGGDYNKLWIKGDLEQGTDADAGGEGAVDVLWSHLLSAWWDVQGGVRVERSWGEGASHTRGLLVVGLEGLAPYRFEVAPALRVSQDGDVSAYLRATWELLFSQRVIGEPEVAVSAAAQDVPEFGIGAGLSDLELGFRLRYEIVRELAPYVGVSWTRRFGATADLARGAGEPVGEGSLVMGLRVWH